MRSTQNGSPYRLHRVVFTNAFQAGDEVDLENLGQRNEFPFAWHHCVCVPGSPVEAKGYPEASNHHPPTPSITMWPKALSQARGTSIINK